MGPIQIKPPAALTPWQLAQNWQPPLRVLVISGALVCFASAAWAIWKGLLIAKLATEIRNCRYGLRGEQAVAEELAERELAAAGYSSFHDVPGDDDEKWNIDHVVVGPAGVFVLETKARPRRESRGKQEKHVVSFDGHILQFPWCYDDEAVEQVKRNSAWVREFLSALPPKNIPIQPIIVLPGWFVESNGNYPVKVMNATYLVSCIKGAKPVFTIDEVSPVVQRLEERCRTLEF